MTEEAGVEQNAKHNSTHTSKLRMVYLGLGSNIAPQENLPKALKRLADFVTIQDVSSAWQTPAVGSPGPDFINAAVSVLTSLTQDELKAGVIRPVEAGLGRVRTADKNAPRTIDIDILVDGEELVEPRVWRDAHQAVPLAELIPNYKNPEGTHILAQAAEQLKRTARVVLRPDVLFTKAR